MRYFPFAHSEHWGNSNIPTIGTSLRKESEGRSEAKMGYGMLVAGTESGLLLVCERLDERERGRAGI